MRAAPCHRRRGDSMDRADPKPASVVGSVSGPVRISDDSARVCPAGRTGEELRSGGALAPHVVDAGDAGGGRGEGHAGVLAGEEVGREVGVSPRHRGQRVAEEQVHCVQRRARHDGVRGEGVPQRVPGSAGTWHPAAFSSSAKPSTSSFAPMR